MSIEYNKKLIPLAKELRKEATRWENHLWYDFLKDYPVRFQRQKAIGNYIVDFYCHKARLAIELDGSQHYDENNYDYELERTEELNKLGIEVVRFPNSDIDTKFNDVCVKIDAIVKRRMTTNAQL